MAAASQMKNLTAQLAASNSAAGKVCNIIPSKLAHSHALAPLLQDLDDKRTKTLTTQLALQAARELDGLNPTT